MNSLPIDLQLKLSKFFLFSSSFFPLLFPAAIPHSVFIVWKILSFTQLAISVSTLPSDFNVRRNLQPSRVHLCVCVCLYMRVHVCGYVYLNAHLCVWFYVCVRLCTCLGPLARGRIRYEWNAAGLGNNVLHCQ